VIIEDILNLFIHQDILYPYLKSGVKRYRFMDDHDYKMHSYPSKRANGGEKRLVGVRIYSLIHASFDTKPPVVNISSITLPR